MAETTDLDLDAQKPSGKKNLILYVIIGVLVLALGATVALLLLNKSSADSAQPVAEVKRAHYLPIDTLVVNFRQGPVRYLQVELQVMAWEERALKAIETHMPAIRNDILLLLSAAEYEQVSTREGKEALRQQITEAVQRLIEERHTPTGEQDQQPPAIESIYFTSFVMQ